MDARLRLVWLLMMQALRPLLTTYKILHDCIAYCEYRKAKTITVHDVNSAGPHSDLTIIANVGKVLFSLKRIGRPIYGFDPDTYVPPNKSFSTGNV
jgi:histone H4